MAKPSKNAKLLVANRTKPRRTRSASPIDGVYSAFSVLADGSRRLLKANTIVIDLGERETEIDLRVIVPRPGQVAVATRSDDVLVVGPGSGGIVEIGVDVNGRRFKTI